MPDVASAFFGPIQAKLDKNEARSMDLRKEKRDKFLAIAQSPDTTDDVRNWALEEYSKQLDPESKSGFKQVQPILHKIFSGPGRKPMDEKLPNGQSVDQAISAKQAGPVPAPGPVAGSTPGPIFNRKAVWAEEDERAKRNTQTKTDEAIRLAQAKPGTTGVLKPMMVRLADGNNVEVQQDSRTHTLYRNNQPFEIPEGGELVQPAKSVNSQKIFMRYPGETEKSDPHLVMINPRPPFNKIDASTGKPVPEGANAIDEGLVLAKMRQMGYGTGELNSLMRAADLMNDPDATEPMRAVARQEYDAITKKQSLIGAGRERQVPGMLNGVPTPQTLITRPIPSAPVPAPALNYRGAAPASQGLFMAPGEAKGLVKPGNIDLRNLRVTKNPDGSWSTVNSSSFYDDNPQSPTYGKEVLVRGILPDGRRVEEVFPDRKQQEQWMKDQYQKTGQQLGVFNSGEEADAYAQRLHNDWEKGKIPGVAMNKPAGGALTPPPAASAAGGTRALPPGSARQYLVDFRTLRTAATQLFGDPTQPDFKGLESYEKIADSKEAHQRMGRALRLTMDGMKQSSEGGSASAGGGGINLGLGGVATWVQNALNMKPAIADQQTKMMQDAVASLTPQEREAYNATLGAIEGVVGLRKLTGASPAQFSVDAIKQMVPMIGVNTFDGKQFQDKMQRLGAEVVGGSQGIPDAALDPESKKFMQHIKGIEGRGRKGPAKAPATNTKAKALPDPGGLR